MPRRRAPVRRCAPVDLADPADGRDSCDRKALRERWRRIRRRPRGARGPGPAPKFWRRARHSALAAFATMLCGCPSSRVIVAQPPAVDGAFDNTINAYDRELRTLTAVDPPSARIVIGRALGRLADALDAMPDSRAGDLTSIAAETVRAGSKRLALAEEGHGPLTPDVKTALVVVSAVMERLAGLVYADSPAILASARELTRNVEAIDLGRPIESQRQVIQSALEAADMTLGLVEAAAAESPFPPRERRRRAASSN